MKIAICTPVHSHPTFDYTKSLGDLLISAGRHELNYLPGRDSALPALRAQLADKALEWGADAILWIDADQTFPEDALDRLLSHAEPIAGANIVRRHEPHDMTAVKGGKVIETTAEKAAGNVLEEVDSLGIGFVLIAREVFERTPKPWFWPQEQMGEDRWFFMRARKAGFRVMCDHALSWQVGHTAEKTLYPSLR